MKRSSLLASALTLGIFTSLAAVGCSGGSTGDGLCAQAKECATKAGEAFSETKCKNDVIEQKEENETAGCGAEWSDYVDCVEGLDLECSDDLDKSAAAECGAEAKKANECRSGASHTTRAMPAGGTSGSRLCARQSECAEKAGESFSEDACIDDFETSKDAADSKGCSDEFADYYACIEGLDLGCGDDLTSRIQAECSEQVQHFSKCTS